MVTNFLPMLERTVLKRDVAYCRSFKDLNATIARYISGVAIDAILSVVWLLSDKRDWF